MIGCNITDVATLCNLVKCDPLLKLKNGLFVNVQKAAWILLQETRQIRESAVKPGFYGVAVRVQPGEV